MRFRRACGVLPEGIVVERWLSAQISHALLIALAITRSGFPAIHTVCTRSLRCEDTLSNVSSFIVFNDSLHMPRSQRDVVGGGAGSGCVEGDCRRGSARRGIDTKGRVLELKVRFNIKIFFAVVLQSLVDDRRDLMFRKCGQLSGVRNGVTRLVHSQLMLDDREAGLGDRRTFVEATTLGAYVAVNLSVTFW